MENIVNSSNEQAMEEKLIDYFCIKASKRCDIGTSERLLNDIAQSKVKIPATFSDEETSNLDLDYVDYEVLPEIE